MSADRPWLKFYPQDWRADEMLRNCSLAARGLWVEMLALMHRSERYGYLLINGRPPADRTLAIQAGATIDEVKSALAELDAEGVFSRDNEGLIYCRRMLRDEEKHRKASSFGKRGVRAKARKQKEEPETLEGQLKPPHEGSIKLRGQRPDNPPVSPKVKGRSEKIPLPDDWEPEEFGEGTDCHAIVDSWPDRELRMQAEKFKAHHEKLGSRFASWQAAWKTWVLNSGSFAQSFGGGGGSRSGNPRDFADIVLEERKVAAPP